MIVENVKMSSHPKLDIKILKILKRWY